ncbi:MULTISPECIES: hypothetical protein [Burkholderia]|uniref:hypothetical protein n=1 Tax=Burkholderia TaxID=32008 RepID=UPI00069E1F04|nr:MULTISPECIES: hypothetical protein [Burkholderia]
MYNILYVPLNIGSWQCMLMLRGEYDEQARRRQCARERDRGGSLIGRRSRYDWSARSSQRSTSSWSGFAERDDDDGAARRQREDDQRTFLQYFQPSYDFRRLIAKDIDAIRSFLSQYFNVAHWNLPTDNAGIERALKQAVKDGKLVPVVNRDWRMLPATFRPTPTPLRWPSLGGNGGAVRAVSYGMSSALGSGEPMLSGPYDPASQAAQLAAARGVASDYAGSAADDDSGGAFDWLGVAEAVTGAALGATVGSADGGGDTATSFVAVDDEGSDASTLLSDAQPFEYVEDLPGGDVLDIAKTPNTGEPGTWYTNPGSGQMRLYGADGNPAVDLDFDHFHNGLKPHAHNWNGAARDGGTDVVPFSPWNP